MANYTSKDIIAKLTGKDVADIEQSWLDWADDKIETKTGESYFGAVSEDVYVDGPGSKVLILPKYPVIEITAIECDGVSVNLNEFKIYYDEGIVSVQEGLNIDHYGLDEVFAKGTKNIKVTGKFGYSEVPKLVEELATLLVIKTMMIRYPDLSGSNVKSEKIGDYSISYHKSNGDIKTAIGIIFDMLTEGPDASSTSDSDIAYF